MENNQFNLKQQELNFDEFELTPFQSKHTSRESGGLCNLTIVNTQKNGKRIAFSGAMLEKIGVTENVRLAFYHNGIAVARDFPGVSALPYLLKKSGKKGVIYNSGLVEELTELFGLDFNGKSSISFEEVRYQSKGDLTIAFVPLRQSSPTGGEIGSEQSEHIRPEEEQEDE